jgi:hypothetical protein
LVPSTQNLLSVLVALMRRLGEKKSVKVAQHEPTAQAVVSLQADLLATLVLKVFTLNSWLQRSTLATPPMVKVTLWNSTGEQVAAALATVAPALVSLAQQ